MKSLEELAMKHGAGEAADFTGNPLVIPVDYLESLINEVISQRLGEPYGYLHYTKQFEQRFTRLKPEGDLYPNVGEVTPLYALNIES